MCTDIRWKRIPQGGKRISWRKGSVSSFLYIFLYHLNFYEIHIKFKIQIINSNNKPSYVILNRCQTLFIYYLIITVVLVITCPPYPFIMYEEIEAQNNSILLLRNRVRKLISCQVSAFNSCGK